MNKTMKISGYVSSVMILFGAIFKFQHWPGASMLLIVGTFFLTVLFLPLLFILKFKSTAESNRSVLLSIIGFVSALLICVGVLFRIMHWPGARITAITGAVLLVLGYLPVYVLSVYKNTTDKINATATVILIIAGVGLLVPELSTGISRPVSDSFWRGVTESESSLAIITKTNQAIYEREANFASGSDSSTIANLKLVHAKTNELTDYIEAIKIYLIAGSEQVTEEQAKKMKIDELRTSGGEQVVMNLLDNQNPKLSVNKLKESIESYKGLIMRLAPKVDLTMLETGTLTVYGEPTTWEVANFEQLPVPLVIFNLNRIELAIKSSENTALNQLR